MKKQYNISKFILLGLILLGMSYTKAFSQLTFEAEGTITAITQTSISVDSIDYEVNAFTRVFDYNSIPIFYSDLLVGSAVKLFGTTVNDVKIVQVIRLTQESEDSTEIEIQGEVTGLTDTTLTVGNITFRVDTQIKVTMGLLNVIFDSVKVGQTVEVKGKVAGTDTLALEIKIKVDENERKEIEVKGIITGITDNLITVNGISFKTDTSTTYFLIDSGYVQFSYLDIGMTVEIKGYTLGTDTIAENVKIEKQNQDDKDYIEITGTITAISLNSVTIDSVTVVIDKDTKIIKGDDDIVGLSYLHIGMVVTARGYIQDSTIIAQVIKTSKSDDDDDDDDDGDDDHEDGYGKSGKIHITGTVIAITDSTIVVDGVVYYFTSKTKVFMRGKAQLSDLREGQIVKIKGYKSGDKFYVFQIKIEFKGNKGVDQKVKGVITAINSNSITIGNLTIIFNSQTVVVLEEMGRGTINLLKVGQYIEIKAYLIDNELIAKIIKIKVDDDWSFRLNGEITAKDDNSITINGTKFIVTPETKFYGDNKTEIAFSDIKLGMFVKVKVLLSGNDLVILALYVVYSPFVFDDENIINLVEDNFIVVGSRIYKVNSETEVFDLTGIMTSYYELVEGMEVNVEDNVLDGELFASKIQIQSTLTGVESVNSSNMNLMNYPNPFNNNTDVNFKLVDDANVVLTLYDANGTILTEIYSGNLPSGEYTFNVNLNDNVSSGIYYVRLIANGQVALRKIIKS